MKHALLVAALLLPTSAIAGERTATPPKFRGDVGFQYRGALEPGRILDRSSSEQTFDRVGSYTWMTHGLDITPRFSVHHGIAVGLDFPLVFHRRRDWSDGYDARFEPEDGKATFVPDRSLSEETLDATPASRDHVGLGDLGILFRLVPFAERGVPGRVAPATLAFDIAIRVPSGENHDAVREDGTAGPGRGGPALELAMTASRRVKAVEPYIVAEAVFSAPYRQVLLDAAMQPLTAPDGDPEGTELNPADSVGVRFGSEITLDERPAEDVRFGVDVGIGVRYVGPHEVSTGTWIPAPLGETVGRPAVEAEHVEADFALGFRIRPRTEIQVAVDLGVQWESPHTLAMIDQHSYTVRTAPANFRFFWGFGVTGRIR